MLTHAMRQSFLIILTIAFLFLGTSCNSFPTEKNSKSEILSRGDPIVYFSPERNLAIFVEGYESVLEIQIEEYATLTKIERVESSDILAGQLASFEPHIGDKKIYVDSECQRRRWPDMCQLLNECGKPKAGVRWMKVPVPDDYGRAERLDQGRGKEVTEEYRIICNENEYRRDDPKCKTPKGKKPEPKYGWWCNPK